MDQIAAIILSGGKGTRINSHSVNKVTLPLHGKPLITWGVDMVKQITGRIVVVVGAYEESVRKVLATYPVTYVYQDNQLGTAHAVQTGLSALMSDPPSVVLVGYGDHMMYYKAERVKDMISQHISNNNAVTIVVSECEDVDRLGYGRIVRNRDGSLRGIVEQKDADLNTRKIKEFNAGLYCFDWKFLSNTISLVQPSPVSHEYYITDLISIALEKNKQVLLYHMPYDEVGMGINSMQDYENSAKIGTI